jgi:hypothetical protein
VYARNGKRRNVRRIDEEQERRARAFERVRTQLSELPTGVREQMVAMRKWNDEQLMGSYV